MWRREPRSGTIIRIAGLALLGVSAGAARFLLQRAGMHPAGPSAIDYLLALATFVSASAGCAMVFVGAHLFDQVEISERWRPLHLDRRSRLPVDKRDNLRARPGALKVAKLHTQPPPQIDDDPGRAEASMP